MKRFTLITTTTTLLLTLTLLLGAGLNNRNAEIQTGLTAEQAAAAFEQLKKLVGTWEAVIDEEGGKMIDTYELIAKDSVLMHTTEFPDQPSMTMVTMYHLDGDDLILKHYCVAQNQPEMKATKISDDFRSIVFTYTGGTNMKSRDVGHMDEAHITFKDKEHYAANWKWYADGDFQEGHKFEFTRKEK